MKFIFALGVASTIWCMAWLVREAMTLNVSR